MFEPLCSPKTRLFYKAEVRPTETDAQPWHDTVPRSVSRGFSDLKVQYYEYMWRCVIKGKQSLYIFTQKVQLSSSADHKVVKSPSLIVPMRRTKPLIGQRGFCVAK